MAKMSPFRWLIIIAVGAGFYVVFLFSWRAVDHSMVPQQINSVALTVFAAGIIFTADCELNDRRDRRRMAPFDAQAEQLAEVVKQLGAIREHLCAGELTTEIPRPSGVYRASAVVANGVDRGAIEVAERLTRRLSAVDD
jgi:hypothetical protein